ncbi:GNAT family N-acetyltransferase [Macrococcus sp. EM39E]|uniref:GNAT family N-acetyltransferase n=1 Tax=Macrococcus animalis TaxID=3395467 RepID=UPI0039BE53E1
MVQLVPYIEQYKEALMQFYQTDGALKFTQTPEKSIEQLNNDIHGVVIMNNSMPIGFFLLHATQQRFEYTNEEQSLLLTSLIMNHSYSGKGHGKHAMLQLPMYIKKHFKQIKSIVLGVNHANIPAQKLYERVHFEDTGRRIEGPIGEQYIYELVI